MAYDYTQWCHTLGITSARSQSIFKGRFEALDFDWDQNGDLHREWCIDGGFSVRSAQSQNSLIKYFGDLWAASDELKDIWEGFVLEKADLGELRTILIAKHFRTDAASVSRVKRMFCTSLARRITREFFDADYEEEEESDEGISLARRITRVSYTSFARGVTKVFYAFREEEEESDQETVTVTEKGGTQTIKASGRSIVKDNTMNGPVTNVKHVTNNYYIVHYHNTRPSTSQRQGNKRKAAGSSGGKKRAKSGR